MMLAGLAGIIIIIFSTLFTCQGRAARGKGLNYDGMFGRKYSISYKIRLLPRVPPQAESQG